MTNVVHAVWHEYEAACGCEYYKLIGIYRTPEAAARAREQAKILQGFRDYPDGFGIGASILGECGWADGFFHFQTDADLISDAEAEANLVASLTLPLSRHAKPAPSGYWIDELRRGETSFGCEVGRAGEKPFGEGVVEIIAYQQAVEDANARIS